MWRAVTLDSKSQCTGHISTASTYFCLATAPGHPIPAPMSAALNRLGASALRGTFRVRPRNLYPPPIASLRHLHASRLYRDDSSKPPSSDASSTSSPPSQSSPEETAKSTLEHPAPEPPSENLQAQSLLAETAASQPSSTAPSASEEISSLISSDSLGGFTKNTLASASEEAKFLALLDDPPPEHRDLVERFKREAKALEAKFLRQIDAEREPDMPTRDPRKRFRPGFLSMGEDDEEDEGEDEPFEGDDMTSLAHGDLEQHRELREYARIAAWEMPLLSSTFLHRLTLGLSLLSYEPQN